MKFEAEISQLREVLTYVRSCAQKSGFSEAEGAKIELACEEALVNIIEHAYEGVEKGIVELSCYSSAEGTLDITIRDWGKPFNPLGEEINIDREAPLHHREPGGLGLYMIHCLATQMRYFRDKGANCLTLVMRK
jgi:anti-sigma regulatory factor (Ser/Thr protein kinase)